MQYSQEENAGNAEVQHMLERKKYGPSVIIRVIYEKLWNYLGRTLSEKFPQPERLLQIMQEEKVKHERNYPITPSLLFADEILPQLKNYSEFATNDFFKSLISKGVLPQDLVSLTHLDELEINFQLAQQGSSYAQSELHIANITVAKSAIEAQAGKIQEICQKLNYTVSDAQVLGIAAASIAIHELGHVIENQIKKSMLDAVMANPKWATLREQYGIFLTKTDAQISIQFVQAFKLFSELPYQTTQQAYWNVFHKEKFATSFELLGMRFAAIDAGVPQHIADSIMQHLIEEKSQSKEALREMLEFAVTHGVKEEFFDNLAGDIREFGKAKNLGSYAYVPSLCTIGYFDIYHEDALRNGFAEIQSELTRPEFTDHVLDLSAATSIKLNSN